MRKKITLFFLFLLIPVVIILAGVIFPSVVTRAIGYTISLIIILLWGMFIKNEKITRWCSLAILILVILSIHLGHIGFHDRNEIYISKSGRKIHLYQDCSTLSHSKVIKVKKAEARILGKRKVCKVCTNRKQREVEIAIEECLKRERNIMIDSLYSYIDFLKRGGYPGEVKEKFKSDFGFWFECEECGALNEF